MQIWANKRYYKQFNTTIMIIQKIKENRRTVAFIEQRAGGQIYFAFGSPSQKGGYIAFDAKDINTAQQKISEYLYPSQQKI